MTYMMDVALQFYVRHGLAIFPCQAKKPLCKNGLKDATTDEATIREMWTKWPKAQVGLPTGARNHLVVVDIDGPAGSEWVKKQDWPHTLTVETSLHRFQLYFKQPDGVTTRNSAGKIAPQVDVRGDGGYVIGPYSFHHKTGKVYLIVRDISGERRTENPLLPWANAPESLLKLVTVNGTPPPVLGDSDTIPQGRRHAAMLSLAGAFRARGFSPETVLANLRVVNELQCKPPLPDDEVRKLAEYVGTKPAGFSRPQPTSAEVVLRSVSAVDTVPVKWLHHGKVPIGFLTLDVGDPGRGKSLANCALAATVSTGGLLPGGQRAPVGNVVYLSAEDSIAQTIRPRLEIAGANLPRIYFVETVKVTLADNSVGESLFSLQRDLEKLEAALVKLSDVKLVVIDPIVAFLGERIDSHKDAEVRRVLSPLTALAEKMNFAVKGIMHLRKADITALLRVSGSIGFVAAARVVWGFGKDPDTDQLVMVPIKNNLAPMGQGIGYTIEDVNGIPRIKWGCAINVSADDALSSELRERSDRGARGEEARDWLKEILNNGPVPEPQIKAKAQHEGLKWRTVRRAKVALKVRSQKTSMGGGWSWELPEGGQEAYQ